MKLIKFNIGQWKKPNMRENLGSKTLYVTLSNQCFKVTEDAVAEVKEMTNS